MQLIKNHRYIDTRSSEILTFVEKRWGFIFDYYVFCDDNGVEYFYDNDDLEYFKEY